MTVLADVDQWVTWDAVLNANSGLVTKEVSGSGAAFSELTGAEQQALRFVAEWLYLRSGERWPGVGPYRYEPTYDDWLAGYGCAGVDDPYYRRTGSSPSRKRIKLGPGPVASIVSVTVNGTALDGDDPGPAEYALIRKRWLVRVDGGSWPGPPTSAYVETSPLVVDYTAGAQPPSLVREAAAIMAGAIVGDRFGVGPKLPAYWQSFTRDGLTVTNRQITDEQIVKAFTGISPILDETLAMLTFEGKPAAARVAVPGRHRNMWVKREIA